MATRFLEIVDSSAEILNFPTAAGIGVDKGDSYQLKYSQNGTVVTVPDSGSAPFAKALTVTAASVASLTSQLKSSIQLTPATAVTTTAGLNAIRGEVGLTTGKTLNGTSYLVGVYGRGNIFGTVDIGSGDLAAVYGKFDLNGATLTSGHIAPLQANIVNPPAASTMVDLIYAESAGGNHINSILKGFAAADYAFDLSEVSAGTFVTTAAGASASKYLRVFLNGVAYKIALLADS